MKSYFIQFMQVSGFVPHFSGMLLNNQSFKFSCIKFMDIIGKKKKEKKKPNRENAIFGTLWCCFTSYVSNNFLIINIIV